MARPRAVLPDREALLALIRPGGRLAVEARPGAHADAVAIAGEPGGTRVVTVSVRARAIDGAANKAIARLLAQALGVPPSRIDLASGATARIKIFRLREA